MKQIIKYIIPFLSFIPLSLWSQESEVLTLDTILERIDRNNVLLQSYGLKAKSYEYNAEAATAWMPPMVGVGTFMTPYPNNAMERDRGNLMLQIEQDIPNSAKLSARKKYIASRADIERANRDITLNDLKAQAKRLYYNWLIAAERLKLLNDNEKILETMRKIEEVRYPYNRSQLTNVYRANAKIEEHHNMLLAQEGIIEKARAWLNSLMNSRGSELFDIDTNVQPVFKPSDSYDTAELSRSRKDITKMDESIRSMQLNIESMQREKKPDFRIRFDHMYPLDAAMPNAFSVMGMMSIPIVPWSSKMYKSEIKSMQYNIKGMQKERSAMLQQTQGMLYGMQYEIESMQKRIRAVEQKIIPELKKMMDANFANYQENKLSLSAVIDSWEALSMMEISVLDEKLKLYEMIVDYEKELYR